MPVEKFRSVAEMPRPGLVPTEQLGARIRATWNRAQQICPTRPQRGVQRFKSVEEANEARERLTIERMRERALVGTAPQPVD
jgi:hypothetical protein